MTAQPVPPAPEQAEPPPVQVAPAPDSRLAQLHAMYPGVKANAEAAAAELKAVVDALKVELTQAAEGQPRIDLIGNPTIGLPGLGLRHVESWRIDSKKLKAADPETYARYAKPSYSWTLKPLGPSGGED